MLVTDFGVVRCASELQPKNAKPPMLVTEAGMVRLVSELQSRNAAPPMLVTETGIVRLVTVLSLHGHAPIGGKRLTSSHVARTPGYPLLCPRNPWLRRTYSHAPGGATLSLPRPLSLSHATQTSAPVDQEARAVGRFLHHTHTGAGSLFRAFS